MKIVHLIGYFQPEFGYQEYYLSKRQAAMGHEVHVITSDYIYPFKNVEVMLRDIGSKETSRKRDVGTTSLDGVTVHRLRSFFRYGDFILASGIGTLLKQIKPDVVIAHEAKQGLPLLAAFYKKQVGYKLIYNIHDFFHEIPNHVRWRKILRYVDYFWFRIHLVRRALDRSDAIVVPVEEIKKFLINKHGVGEYKISLIPLAVETGLFQHSEQARESIRARYGIIDSDVVITFAGHIDRRKNLEFLIDIFNELNKEYSLHLFIIGSGDVKYLNQLKAKAHKTVAKEVIHFMGYSHKREIIEYYSASDIAVWPGNNSISIMEAMACQLPVVAVNLQLGYLISPETGFTFSIEYPDQFKKQLGVLIRKQTLRITMGERAREVIINDFSEENRVKQIMQLIDSLG